MRWTSGSPCETVRSSEGLAAGRKLSDCHGPLLSSAMNSPPSERGSPRTYRGYVPKNKSDAVTLSGTVRIHTFELDDISGTEVFQHQTTGAQQRRNPVRRTTLKSTSTPDVNTLAAAGKASAQRRVDEALAALSSVHRLSLTEEEDSTSHNKKVYRLPRGHTFPAQQALSKR